MIFGLRQDGLIFSVQKSHINLMLKVANLTVLYISSMTNWMTTGVKRLSVLPTKLPILSIRLLMSAPALVAILIKSGE